MSDSKPIPSSKPTLNSPRNPAQFGKQPNTHHHQTSSPLIQEFILYKKLRSIDQSNAREVLKGTGFLLSPLQALILKGIVLSMNP